MKLMVTNHGRRRAGVILVLVLNLMVQTAQAQTSRQRINLNAQWRFMKYETAQDADHLIYDVRPENHDRHDDQPADAQPTEAVAVETKQHILKPWILPSGNDFIKDPAQRHARPDGDPGNDFSFTKLDFDDSHWQPVDLPHDWAIQGPFYQGWNTPVGGGMGRLPSPGVAWYRKQIEIPVSDAGKSIFLDIDGAMSYAMVWCNGHLVGGWPYGYASWRVDLTPYIEPGQDNQLAIRLDNPPESSRWYPGGGIYRNVWLVKTDPVHVAQWGTKITTSEVSQESAVIDLEIAIENDSSSHARIKATTDILALDGKTVTSLDPLVVELPTGQSGVVKGSVTLKQPKLWGPPPTQTPNLYLAVTSLWQGDRVVDRVETRFGIRDLRFDPNHGLCVNGELIEIQGVNQHHDLGALGAAFNRRAAQRQLEMLREMGCNAIRMAHNPPAPELLELTDRMGFLVVDEIFDVWERKKTHYDFHLIFKDWSEPDLRALIRRDRNCPSVIMWSVGNEVGEQYTDQAGAAVAQRLHEIAQEEDPTRPTTSAMNWAKPHMPLPTVLDLVSLNYQGQGIRQDPEFEGTNRIRTKPQFPDFHQQFPDKVIVSSETASAFSSRGVYLFPVTDKASDIVRDGRGGDAKTQHVTAYELHAVDFGASADKVFKSLEQHPFVAGEFVWTGWDYLGEPTPYYESRSSYCGIIDLAGFKKDRFYLYQSHWRPDLPMAHILPHWTWPERVGEVTPVHIFTSGDEAELFLNGKSLGRQKKGPYEYRLRWDEVQYEPGELKVVAYRNGQPWAEDMAKTAGNPVGLQLTVDRDRIYADGQDLAFVTARVIDAEGLTFPRADHRIGFSLEGPGQIVATDNGDPTDMTPFVSPERQAFSGLCLAIVRGLSDQTGSIKINAESPQLTGMSIQIHTQK